MSVNKKYVANNRRSMLLILGGRGGQLTLEFKPGYGFSHEGCFLSNDESIQEALESDPRFNKSYRLAQIDNMDVAEFNARKVIKDSATSKPVPEKIKEEVVTPTGDQAPKEKVEETPQVPEIPSFKTIQDAKNWLNKVHKVPFSQLGNKKKIFAKVEELKLNIKIEN